MTAVDLRNNTLQLLQRFDKGDVALWEKVHKAVSAIYYSGRQEQSRKREEQKNKIRQMIGILNDKGEDWKLAKEEYLTEKYL